MTRIRSESERISSSSSETSRIAAALVALGDEPAVDELDRADVEAARRLRGDQHRRVAVDLAGEHDLLLVAAGERAGARRRAAAAHVELLEQPRARARSGGPGRASRTASRARRGSRAARCSRRARSRGRARGAGGPRGCGRRPRRASSRALACVERPCRRRVTVPLADAPQAGDRVDQLGLAVAVDAGDPDDLARAHLEARRRLHRLEPAVVEDVQVLDLEQRLAGRRPAVFSTRSSTSRPTISRARLVLGRALARARSRSSCRGAATVIRSAISSTSFSLWRDEDDRLPLRR